jgi:anthranilate phosphoribosyltransferase
VTGDAAVAAALRTLAGGGTLTADAAAAAFAAMMRGDAAPTQVAALLMGLRVRGETPDEVAGAATALRAAMRRLEVPDPGALVDTCGTGGGAVTTFNISTAAALLAAGAGARVAKHGNRSFTSRSGSADVLEALGVPVEGPVERLPEVLATAGICFMFAPLMHPAMRHVGPVRRELGIPTVMNIVGPLANPAGATRQVVGVADEARLPLIAGALAALGAVRALVVHGAPGMDEVSPLGPTRVLEVRDGRLTDGWTIDPARFGLRADDAAELAGGDPSENAAVIEAVLRGGGPRGARAAVVLNAAAALVVGDLAPDYATAVGRATAALDAGLGFAALERLRRAVSTA